VGRNISWVNH